MITKAFYTLQQAAMTLKISPDVLLKAIKDGTLKANFMNNIGTYMIARDDLMKFMKEQKNFKGLVQEMRPRVLLVDRDVDTTTLLQSELEHGLNIDARLATSEMDIVTMLGQYIPDLICIHVGATLRSRDQIRDVLFRAKEKHAKVVLYHRYDPAFLATNEDLRKHIETLQADAIVSMGSSVRPLVDQIAAFLRPSKKK